MRGCRTPVAGPRRAPPTLIRGHRQRLPSGPREAATPGCRNLLAGAGREECWPTRPAQVDARPSKLVSLQVCGRAGRNPYATYWAESAFFGANARVETSRRRKRMVTWRAVCPGRAAGPRARQDRQTVPRSRGTGRNVRRPVLSHAPGTTGPRSVRRGTRISGAGREGPQSIRSERSAFGVAARIAAICEFIARRPAGPLDEADQRWTPRVNAREARDVDDRRGKARLQMTFQKAVRQSCTPARRDADALRARSPDRREHHDGREAVPDSYSAVCSTWNIHSQWPGRYSRRGCGRWPPIGVCAVHSTMLPMSPMGIVRGSDS